MNRKIICLVTLLSTAMTPAFAQYSLAPLPRLINLSGSAEVKAAPDEIMLGVAIETRAETLEPARLENDQKIAAALAFLKKRKIKDSDIQMDYINIQPYYDNNNNSSVSHVKPVAYIIRKNLEIRIKDVTAFQDVLTGLLTHGVNYVDGIDFRTTELRKYRDQARAMAIHAAKEKAEALTSELGAKLGKVNSIEVNENSGYYGGYRSLNGSMNGFINASQNVSNRADTGATDNEADNFAVGQISVTANVTVSFVIE